MSNNILGERPFISINNATSNSLLKLLVFEIKTLTLALPVNQVKKVVRSTEIHGSGLSYVNLSHLEEQEVAIVDLHHKLFKVNQSNDSQKKGYFIITKDNIIGEPLGVWIDKTPSLIDVSLDRVRTIPHSYRRSDTLEIASHVAVITQENKIDITIFIIDIEQLITNIK